MFGGNFENLEPEISQKKKDMFEKTFCSNFNMVGSNCEHFQPETPKNKQKKKHELFYKIIPSNTTIVTGSL